MANRCARPVVLRSTSHRAEQHGSAYASTGDIRLQDEGLPKGRGVSPLCYRLRIRSMLMTPSYCNRTHKAQGSASVPPNRSRPDSAEGEEDSQPSIYHTLLSLYLSPPPPHQQNLGPALDLLSKHGSRLPAASTLSLIPDSLPVSELESYFRGRMRSANSAINETRIVVGLQKTELVSSQALLLLGDGIPRGQGGRNRRVLISEERVCRVCHKRLGASVVAAMPDNSVVHYGCMNRAQSGAGAGGALMAAQLGAWGRAPSRS